MWYTDKHSKFHLCQIKYVRHRRSRHLASSLFSKSFHISSNPPSVSTPGNERHGPSIWQQEWVPNLKILKNHPDNYSRRFRVVNLANMPMLWQEWNEDEFNYSMFWSFSSLTWNRSKKLLFWSSIMEGEYFSVILFISGTIVIIFFFFFLKFAGRI